MKKIKLIWLAFFTLAMMTIMTLQWNYTQPKTAKSLISLELVREQADAMAIVNTWNIAGAIQNTYIDFLFIIAYAGFLFAAMYRFASLLKGWLNKAGKGLAYLAPVAGILDYIENFKMLQFLNDQNNFSSPFYVAAIKWGIAGLLVLLVIILPCAYVDQRKGTVS
ncbi:MAG: hypothetical protein V4722_05775 [Bacteroidota bacterium]